MRRLGILVVLLIVAWTGNAGAQQLRGAVRDSASGAPIPGVVVTLLDAAGASVGRTISDASGRYSVGIAPAATRVRIIRIGFRPRDMALPSPDRRDAFNLAMERVPPILEAVRVSGSELCPGSTDRGSAFQAWEQARAGLLATVVAREAKPAQATTMIYESGMSPGDERIRRQTKRLKSGTTTRPFVASNPPAFFARNGYMLEERGGDRVFNAPDADVLVDETFAATHCFRIQSADADHLGQIGLAFTPIPGRDTLVDVKGVIWMDARTPQLRSLDFTYTALEPAAMQMRAGGHIEFRTMENGVAFIERWFLRLPVLTIAFTNTSGSSNRTASIGPPRRMDRTDLRVSEIVEAGGDVLLATWSDGTKWQETPTLITGIVRQRDSKAPLDRGIVTLLGTSDTVSTTAGGEFELSVIPGKYTIVAADTMLQSFVEARSRTMPVEVARGATTNVQLEVSPLAGVISEVCRGQRMAPRTSIIVGNVSVRGRATPRDAIVRATWLGDYLTAGSGVQVVKPMQEISLDDRGRFVVCGVAPERPISLTLISRREGAIGDTAVTVPNDVLSFPVTWFVDPSKQRAATTVAEDAAIAGTIVTDAQRAPIADAEISIPALARSVKSGPDGTFALERLPAGKHLVEIRHVGDEPRSDSVQLSAGTRYSRTFALKRAVTALDTVRTSAAMKRFTSAALQGFEERRARGGGGQFLSDSVLRANESRDMASVLAMMAGLTIQRSGRAIRAVNNRHAATAFGPKESCYATVYLDGIMVWELVPNAPRPEPPPDLSALANLNQLSGIEYYAGIGTVPTMFKQSPCGVIALWTRER